MSVEENLQVNAAIIEAVNAQDWDRYVGLHAESVVSYGPESPEPRKGREALRESIQAYVTAFPDLRFEEVRTFGQGDWVCAEWVATGTHTGPLMGPGGETIPATNKTARVSGSSVLKVEGGKVTEIHGYYDLLGMMAQLGLAP